MLASLALVAVLIGGPVKPAPCSHIDWRGGTPQRERMVTCLARRFPRIDPDTALRVARCESGPGLDPKARLGTSSGMWQHQMPYWRARALRYLTPRWGLNPRTVSPFNAYASTIVTFSMVSDRDIGWEPWSCYR